MADTVTHKNTIEHESIICFIDNILRIYYN